MKWFLAVQFATTISFTYSTQLNKNFNDKRDITISYASTDIGSQGTNAKTVTFIKHFSDKDNKKEIQDLKKIQLEPINFYGKLPDVPDDIEELFDYVKKKEKPPPVESRKEIPIFENSNNKKSHAKGKYNPKPDGKRSEENLNNNKMPITTNDENNKSNSNEKVEKIFGDVELIGVNTKNSKIKSQSLSLGKHDIPDLNRQTELNSSKDDKTIRRDVNKNKSDFVQAYNYNVPNKYSPLSQSSVNTKDTNYQNQGSVKVTTPSGRNYDVPIPNTTSPSPYLAPINYKRTNQNNKNGNVQRQPFPTSSQRPYIAPKLRITSAGSPNTNNIQNSTTSRPNNTNINNSVNQSYNSFKLNNNNYQPKIFRSRGLRY